MQEYTRNPNTNCIVCDKKVYKRPVEIERNKGRVFCSMACYGISCRKEIPCVICGTPLLAGANKKTCSRSCANKYRTVLNIKSIGPEIKLNTIKV